jgi:hypothetical protein
MGRYTAVLISRASEAVPRDGFSSSATHDMLEFQRRKRISHEVKGASLYDIDIRLHIRYG